MPVTIESVQKWECVADVADRFRDGRIFLAGDAAHVMPPYGGFGGNTGIHDAHNLAWKLALVLEGTAGAALLDSYEAERRPIAELTTGQGYTRYVVRGALHLAQQGTPPFVTDLNIDLGFRYRSAAVIAEPGDDGAIHENPRESFGRPGTRASHVYLEQDGVRVSTIDFFGQRFVLWAGPEGSAWVDPARRAALALGLRLDVHHVGAPDLRDPDDRFASSYGIRPGGAVLVRPDGVVAWRSTPADTASDSTLAGVLGRVLDRA